MWLSPLCFLVITSVCMKSEDWWLFAQLPKCSLALTVFPLHLHWRHYKWENCHDTVMRHTFAGMYTVMPYEWPFLFMYILVLAMWKGGVINSNRLGRRVNDTDFTDIETVVGHTYCLFVCCLFMNLGSLYVKLLCHPGECVSIELCKGCWSCTYTGCGFLNLHSGLEPEKPKASLLLLCFILLDAGCGLMKG